MGRKGRSITISLSDEDKARLEDLALHYGMTWGDRANISELIKSIANKKLKVAPNHDWKRERIVLLNDARKLFVDAGKMNEAKAIAKLLCDRTELTIPDRQQLEDFLDRDIQPWRIQVERYIEREQPFRLAYQDAADNLFQFSIRHAQIVLRNDRQYLDCWCEETGNSRDLPQLAHNRTLRLDKIIDASVSATKTSWLRSLDTITVEMHLYNMLAFNYSSKKGHDISVEWLPGEPRVRRVVREITNTFWFLREVLPYGPDCEVVGPLPVREQVKKAVNNLAQRYAD